MPASNQAQIDLWDGRVGQKFAALQASVDALLTHATAALMARAGSVAGQRVLDIGCGNGKTCVMLLERGAKVTGVDVSGPMLAVAARRTGGKADLIKADASVWRGDAPFDLAISQLGTMFFADPDAAFANIAANLRSGGRLLLTTWRPAAENSWVSISMGAIRDLLPPAEPADPHAPGPFALAERARLRGIVARAGFVTVTITPFDFPMLFATTGGVEPAVKLAMETGPSGAALVGASAEVLAAAKERLAAALAPHERDGALTLGGAIWMVDATRAH